MNYILNKDSLNHICDYQKTLLLESFSNCPQDEYNIYIKYEDKNYECMPYLENALNSKVQGLSFFSGAGGLDIGAQMAGIKVLYSLDFEKDAIETLKANKFFAHTEHRLDDIRNVKGSDYAKILKGRFYKFILTLASSQNLI